MAEAWEDGSTTLTIKAMETFSCEVDFQYSLQQGVKFKEISSVCSGSSSQSNDDVIDKLGNHKFSLKTIEGIELECEVGAALLEDSKSLSGEVLTSSLKCEAVEADCVTVEGEVYPAKCVIPFNSNGRRYLGCTDRPGSTKLWCPTKTDETGEAEDDHWGFCSKKCGYCGGSPITTRDGQEESCGYDCLLGSEWDMVGYDKAPLLKPTISVILPKETNYIAEKGGQHQLNIGPQLVTISCPNTKFYDPALRQEASVNVKCGPQKYRLTITTESGATLGENFKNDQFGCDPCPLSMSYVVGYMAYITDLIYLRYFFNIETIGMCNEKCSENPNCKSFQYSESKKVCELIQDVVKESTLSSKQEGYIVCAQEEAPRLCGTNPDLVPDHLIAEKNWPYLSQALNQAYHPNLAYRTHVFEVVTENGDTVMTSTDCPVSDPGLVSLFIAPSSVLCSADTLGASSTIGLHHLMITASCDLDSTIKKFIMDKDKFKQYFNGVPMKLCGARTWMKTVVAESRKQTLLGVFRFLYNTDAKSDEFDLHEASDCRSNEETTKTLKTLFYTSKVEYLNEYNEGSEEDGFIEIPFIRSTIEKKGIAFVETKLGDDETSSDLVNIDDIVPYSGLVFFPANSASASLFITIIEDNLEENEEVFTTKLIYSKQTRPTDGDSNSEKKVYTGSEKTKCQVKGTEAKCDFEATYDLRDVGNKNMIWSRRKASTCSSYEFHEDKQVVNRVPPWCYIKMTLPALPGQPQKKEGLCGDNCPGVKRTVRKMAEENKKKKCECGIRNVEEQESRIHDGKDASSGEFPWQVALLNKDGNVYSQFCGGTLVGEKHIITAAHCVDKGNDQEFMTPQEIKVLIGATNLVMRKKYSKLERLTEPLSDIRVHPKYTKTYRPSPEDSVIESIGYDLAVLVLQNAVDLSTYPHIKPACLPFGNTFEKLQKLTVSIVSGWGLLGTTDPSSSEIDPSSSELKYINVKLLEKKDTDCKLLYKEEEESFCAIGQSTKHFLRGDSGGPLVVQQPSNEFKLVGTVSVEYGPSQPGIYADITYLLNVDVWLKTALMDGKTCNGDPIIPKSQWSQQHLSHFGQAVVKEITSDTASSSCEKDCNANPRCQFWKSRDDDSSKIGTCTMYAWWKQVEDKKTGTCYNDIFDFVKK